MENKPLHDERIILFRSLLNLIPSSFLYINYKEDNGHFKENKPLNEVLLKKDNIIVFIVIMNE